MKDKMTEISHAVFRCLHARLNEYADQGRLVTPESDAAEILAEKGGHANAIAELKNRKAYSFAKSAPRAEQRYRQNRFTDRTFSISVWHPDAEGEWIFVPSHDDRFIYCDAPGGETAWKLPQYASRGEFRRFDQVASSIGEADLLADAEMRAD